MEIQYGRKRKGIIKEIKEKIQDWIDSIDDEKVKKSVKKDAILTGGSIASMLLGEKINDFYFYFRTKETAKLVAEYYVEKFGHDEIEVKEDSLKNIKNEVEDRVIIFVPSEGIAEREEPEEDELGKYHPVFLSQNAITLSNKIQVVIRFYGEPEKIHDNYDFIHAMCYWDNGEEELVTTTEALEAMMSRTLYYRGSLYPIASIFRMKKFLDRGWRISAGQQLKIMWQISEIDLSNKEVMREQLTGVDQAYLNELIDALSGVDQEKINSTYVGEIIDRIFD